MLDAAYIVIHHFSKENTSTLIELLSRHSKLRINYAAEGMMVEANRLYILPDAHWVSLENGCFSIGQKKNPALPEFTTDYFFKSLASGWGSKAIAIILSGTGTDGIAGLKAIKSSGGTVIVRNPKTTVNCELPTNAIASGTADFILEPELMHGAIAAVINNSGYHLQQVMR